MTDLSITQMSTFDLERYLKLTKEKASQADIAHDPVMVKYWVEQFEMTLKERHKRGYGHEL
jgi:hypothetical protein